MVTGTAWIEWNEWPDYAKEEINAFVFLSFFQSYRIFDLILRNNWIEPYDIFVNFTGFFFERWWFLSAVSEWFHQWKVPPKWNFTIFLNFLNFLIFLAFLKILTRFSSFTCIWVSDIFRFFTKNQVCWTAPDISKPTFLLFQSEIHWRWYDFNSSHNLSTESKWSFHSWNFYSGDKLWKLARKLVM